MAVISKRHEEIKHILFTSFFLIAVPLFFVGIIYVIMCLWMRETQTSILYTSFGMGLLLGSLYHLMCIITGLFKNSLTKLKENIVNFKEDSKVSFKLAFSFFFSEFSVVDVEFVVYLTIILGTLIPGIICVVNCIQYFAR